MQKVQGLALAMLLACSFSTKATIVSIAGQGALDGRWDIEELASSYGDAQSTVMNQVWWGDSTLAGVFAQALGSTVITTPSYNASQDLGALFAFAEEPAPPDTNLLFKAWFTDTTVLGTFRGIDFASTTRPTTFVYATATRVPEPGTLALLGVGILAITLSRTRRNRQGAAQA